MASFYNQDQCAFTKGSIIYRFLLSYIPFLEHPLNSRVGQFPLYLKIKVFLNRQTPQSFFYFFYFENSLKDQSSQRVMLYLFQTAIFIGPVTCSLFCFVKRAILSFSDHIPRLESCRVSPENSCIAVS